MASDLEVIEEPRSAWMVSWPGTMLKAATELMDLQVDRYSVHVR